MSAMQPKPIVEYPSTPPLWLEHWPSERAVRELFAEGVRRLAYRFLGIERRRHLTWTADRLVLELGNQQATWRWDGKAWRRSCTCGYTNDRCAHTYAAACVLTEVVRHEQWSAAETRPGTPREALAATPPAARLSLTAEAVAPELVRGGPAASAQLPAQLEVEADFHHEPGLVVLRFYRRCEDRRELLRLQAVSNLAIQSRFGAASSRWPPDDASFLKWLAPLLQRRHEVRSNLQVLKLSKSDFDRWLERWEESPGRFIERSSQQCVSRRGRQPAQLVIELTDEGEWLRIGAVLVLPSGARQPFHAVFQRLAAGGEESVVSGEILRFRPPLSWDLLTRVFSRKDPRMRREHICEHLADLLEGRLDLVEGACVRREPVRDRELLIEAVPDGSDVMLRATLAGVPVTGDGAATAGIRGDATGFVIEVCDTPAVRGLCATYKELGATDSGGGRMRVPGVPQKMELLRQTWGQLPPAVSRRAHPALQGLLEGSREVCARIALREERNFVDVSVRWECAGVQVSDSEMREALRLGRGTLRTREGNWLALDPAQAQAAAQRLEDLGLDALAPVRLLRQDAKERLHRLGEDRADARPWTPACQHLGERILAEPDPEPLLRPPALATILRPYQEAGFEFLADRSVHGVGAILADDMGLGKTLQVLALLEAWGRRSREAGKRFRTLVVCPASVVGVWLEQAARFCPFLNCQAAVGPADARAASLEREDWDVLVTHYALLRLDAEALTARSWDMVVLDEAQNIKNPEAQVTRIAKALRTTHTLALTGTPLENRLLDLWSVLDFLNPGLLGPAADFAARYGASGQLRALSARISPLLLRRTKDAVAPELPPRSEEVLRVEMTPGQRQVYDRELLRAREAVKAHGTFDMLAALTRLRQICCDPALLAGAAGEEAGSAKLETLVEMLVELAEEGHFSLVFSQFTSMLERIRAALEKVGLPYLVITGETPTEKRAELVRQYAAATTPTVFLLSLRAAGTGLTLTRADYVFIFDPWWNPAVERQAIDRTHRIGQEKPVFAYRLVASNSVEEKVLALQQEKAELFAAVMGDAEQGVPAARLSAEDIRLLLS